jgi:hypothetical protein
MRNNKILAAAIASALSLGAGSAYGAMTLELMQPGCGDDSGAIVACGETGYPAFASELFPDKEVATPLGDPGAATAGATDGWTAAADDYFVVRFRPGMGENFYGSATSMIVKATLSEGTWGQPLVPAQIQYCSSPTVTFGAAFASCGMFHDVSPVVISKGDLQSTDKENVADFVIQKTSGSFNASDYIFFMFDVAGLDSFAGNGTLSLTMEASANIGIISPIGSKTITIARSVKGASIEIKPNADSQVIAVDVAQDGKQFIKGTNNTKTVELGYLQIAKGSENPKNTNGSSEFSIKSQTSKKATLTVIEGIFSASKGENAVFLDVNQNGLFDTGDIAGTVQVDGTTAVWELNSTQIDSIYDATLNRAKIMVVADGTNEILTRTVAPKGAFELYITGSGTPTRVEGKLRHIKSNGLKCTLYNIPDGTPGRGSLDGVSVRFTNKSKTATGTIYGEMFDEKGQSIYGSRKTLATDVGPLKTLRFNTGEGDTADGIDLTFSQYNWAGQRARLVITSNLQDAEVFALVRNVQGGPSMNVSTGATGSGCVE